MSSIYVFSESFGSPFESIEDLHIRGLEKGLRALQVNMSA
jgi:hypothetical protein